MDLVARFPWWVGVLLALVSYLVLNALATQPKPGALKPGDMGAFVQHSLLAVFAGFGRYIVPVLCLFGALGSFLARRKRAALMDNVTKSNSADSLNGMSWREFEMLVGEAFRLQGFAVSEQGGGGADGGIDLRLRKGGEIYLVQCKQWRALKVPVTTVRELYGVMAAEGAAGGFVVTSGRFTAEAVAFAQGRNVRLVDGPKLFGLIRQARVAREASGAAPPRVEPSLHARPSAPHSTPQPSVPLAVEPTCPTCGSSMVSRVAKKGASAGAVFWGCSRYPGCRGTRPVA